MKTEENDIKSRAQHQAGTQKGELAAITMAIVTITIIKEWEVGSLPPHLAVPWV